MCSFNEYALEITTMLLFVHTIRDEAHHGHLKRGDV
jgi:hypothetical protein